jgi:hypothetical protein
VDPPPPGLKLLQSLQSHQVIQFRIGSPGVFLVRRHSVNIDSFCLPDCQTVFKITSRCIPWSYSLAVSQSHSLTVAQSHCLTVSLSHCHVTLLLCCSATLFTRYSYPVALLLVFFPFPSRFLRDITATVSFLYFLTVTRSSGNPVPLAALDSSWSVVTESLLF